MYIPAAKLVYLQRLIGLVYGRHRSVSWLAEALELILALTESDFYSLYLPATLGAGVVRSCTNNSSKYMQLYSQLSGQDYIFDKMYATMKPTTLLGIIGTIDNPDVTDDFSMTLKEERPLADICYAPLIVAGNFVGFSSICRAGRGGPRFSQNAVDIYDLCSRFLREACLRSLRSDFDVAADAVVDAEGNVLSAGDAAVAVFKRLFGARYWRSPGSGEQCVHRDYRRRIRTFLAERPSPGSGGWRFVAFDSGYRVQMERLRPPEKCAPSVAGPAIALSVRKISTPPGDRFAAANTRRNLGLTETELRVAERVCRGMSNAEISASLAISEETVKRHVYNIFGKTGVTKRTRLILSFLS